MKRVISKILSIVYGSVVFIYLIFCYIINFRLDYFTPKPRPNRPKLLDNSQWGKHKNVFLKKQGILLHYVENGDESRPTILCLHGFPQCWLAFRHQLSQLSQKFRMIALDMRGYGDSDKPLGLDAYQTPILIQDVQEFIKELDLNKVILLSHDWGGRIGWLLMDKIPETFILHVSLNGSHPYSAQMLRWGNLKQFMMSWYILFFRNPILPEILFKANDLAFLEKIFSGKDGTAKINFPDDVMECYKYYYSQKGAFTHPINYYRCSYLYEPQPFQCKVPTLVIWGMKDTFLSHKLIDKTIELNLCYKMEVKYIEDGGHFILEEAADEVNRSIIDYCENNNIL